MKWVLLVLLFSSFVIAECGSNQVNINSADADELDSITWVGPATAEKIIMERPFDSLENLDKVSGIGKIKVSDIINEGLACVEEENVKKKIDIEKNVESDKNNVKDKGNVDGKKDLRDVKDGGKNVKKNIERIILTKPPIEIISLNGNKEMEETVYESKNSLVFKYLPYGFSLFLIFIILALVYRL